MPARINTPRTARQRRRLAAADYYRRQQKKRIQGILLAPAIITVEAAT
mgnify:FL=1